MTLQREQKPLGWWVAPLTLTWSLPDLGRIRQVSGHLVQAPYPWGRVQILKCAEGPRGGLRQNFPGDWTVSWGLVVWGSQSQLKDSTLLISALPPPPCICSENKVGFFKLIKCSVDSMAFGILVSRPGMEPTPPTLEVQSLKHWTGGEVPEMFCCCVVFYFLTTLGNNMWYLNLLGFPGGASGKKPTCQCRRHERCGFDSCVGKIC